MMQNEKRENGNKSEKISKKLLITLITLSAILLALIITLILQPIFMKNASIGDLNKISENKGKITAINTEMIAFPGVEIETANSSQKALSLKGELTEPASFIFRSDKVSNELPILDFYVDFSEQRGRDSLILNSDSIKGLVESGQIELRVHALLGGQAYSMYSAEALAETFASNPAVSWDTMLGLLKESAQGVTIEDPELVAEFVENVSQKYGSTKVNKESIQNGTFASWLITVGNDPKLVEGVGLPFITLNDESLNLSIDQLNDSEELKTRIIGRL